MKPAPAPLSIRLDDLRGPEIAALLAEHLSDMRDGSPPESMHAHDLDRLRASDIAFWTAWQGRELAGCGALKQLDPTHGEIKSMRTAAAFRRRGVAAAVLAHIVAEARRRGYRRLSLETGSQQKFLPAIALYERAGFVRCAPFADYVEDPLSVYMALAL